MKFFAFTIIIATVVVAGMLVSDTSGPIRSPLSRVAQADEDPALSVEPQQLPALVRVEVSESREDASSADTSGQASEPAAEADQECTWKSGWDLKTEFDRRLRATGGGHRGSRAELILIVRRARIDIAKLTDEQVVRLNEEFEQLEKKMYGEIRAIQGPEDVFAELEKEHGINEVQERQVQEVVKRYRTLKKELAAGFRS